ncbi:MAG: outer membrane protein assembly factor, partial [Planctomycetota bacterium]
MSGSLFAFALAMALQVPGSDPDSIVAEIRVLGNQRVSEEQVLEGLGSQIGKPLDSILLTETIRGLFDRFGIRITAQEEQLPKGIRVDLHVYEEALATRVEATGVPATRGRPLLEKFGLGGVCALVESQLREKAGAIEQHLKSEGYYFAVVRPRLEVREGEVVGLLEIHEGPQVEVDSIEFIGLKAIDPDHLEMVMTTQPTRFIVLESYLRQDLLEEDLAHLQEFVHREGFLDGQVSLEALDFSPEQDEVVIRIRVQEGPRYTVGSIRVEGHQVLSTLDLYGEIELSEGDPLRDVILTKDRERITSRYGDMGYIRCQVEPQVTFAEEGTEVAVRYVVDEGKQKRIRAVVIRGNAKTKNVVLRRESTLDPGDLTSVKELRRTTDRLKALGFFVDDQGRNRVQVRYRPTSDPMLEDLFIDVDDAAAASFVSAGAGVSPQLGFWGAVQLSKNNFDLTDTPSSWNPVTVVSEFMNDEAFHGGGQQLAIRAMPGDGVSSFLLSFTEPYLFSDDAFPYSLNVEVYRRMVSLFEEFEEDRIGVATTLGKQIDEHWSAGVVGRLDLVTVDGDVPDDVADVEGSNFVPSLGLFGRYEQLDSIRDPRDGYTVSARYELLGADAFGHRAVVDGTYFLPVMEDSRGRQQMISLRGAVGAAQGFGGELPFFERLNGGGTTGQFPIRGFQYRGVGPEASGVHLGGQLAWAASAEYRFPLYSSYDPMLDEEVEILNGVLFLDTGSVEETLGELLGQPRIGLGAGLRFRLPFLGETPVALDFAVPVLSESGDESELFSIRV